MRRGGTLAGLLLAATLLLAACGPSPSHWSAPPAQGQARLGPPPPTGPTLDAGQVATLPPTKARARGPSSPSPPGCRSCRAASRWGRWCAWRSRSATTATSPW